MNETLIDIMQYHVDNRFYIVTREIVEDRIPPTHRYRYQRITSEGFDTFEDAKAWVTAYNLENHDQLVYLHPEVMLQRDEVRKAQLRVKAKRYLRTHIRAHEPAMRNWLTGAVGMNDEEYDYVLEWLSEEGII